MSKIDINLKVIRDTLMASKLFAVVCCDCVKVLLKWFQEIDDCISDGLSCLTFNLFNESQAGLPFCQGDDCLAMSFADDRIHFPISQALACIHDSRPLVDAHPVFDLSTPVIASIALPTLLLAS